MAFDIADSVNNKIHKPYRCTPECFEATLTSLRVARAVGEVRRIQAQMDMCEEGSEVWKELDKEKRKAKNQLPIFCFHATFDGERTNSKAHASGLSSIDVDHIKCICRDMVSTGRLDAMPDFAEMASPVWAYHSFIKGREEELGIALVAASCSGDGLRVVFVKPADMDIPQSQEWLCEKIGLPKDDGVKDLARASYSVTKEDVLYINELRLFHTPEPGDDDPANVTNRANSKGTGSKGKSTVKKMAGVAESGAIVQGEYNPQLQIEGVPVSRVVEAYWHHLHDAGVIKGEVPVEGERHKSLMSLARDLAPYLDMDADSVMAALPRLKDDEKEMADIARDSIAFLISNDITKRSRVIASIIKDMKAKDALCNAYPSLKSCEEFEDSLPPLPKCLTLALKILRPGYRFPAMMVILALSMCLADRVIVKMGLHKADRLRGLLHLDGLSGSGKGISFIPAKCIMRTLKEKNDRAMVERSNWKAESEQGEAKGKKEKKKVDRNRLFPDIRIMPRATTDNGQMEVAQHGRTLLTMEEELAGLVRQFKKSSYDRSSKMMVAFDGSDDGNLTQVGASINRNVDINWVIITSGTRSALNLLIKHNGGDVCDGLANRLGIVLMPRDNVKSKLVAEYSDEDEARLREMGEILSEMHGEFNSKRLDMALDQWKEQFEGETTDSYANVKHQLNGRVAHIAFRFACAMQLFYEVDKILKLDKDARSYDMGEVKESQYLQEWGIVFADYFLDKQYSIFGKAIIRQNLTSFTDIIPTYSPSWLDQMPSPFTYQDMLRVLGRKSENTFRMKIKRAKEKMLIECSGRGKDAIYHKIMT